MHFCRPGVSGHLVAKHVVMAINQDLGPVLHIATMSNRVIYQTALPVLFEIVSRFFI